MPLFEWNYTFVLGIKDLDQQRKFIIELVRRLHDNLKGEAQAAELQSTLRVLLLHARFHFDFEERWMKETGYPEFEDHKSEHDAFKAAFLELHTHTEEAPEILVEKILHLRNWVTHHIMETDVKFTAYLVASKNWAAQVVTAELPIHLMIEKYLSS